MAPSYKASKTRSSRPGWSVIFRHPLRFDSRNRRGLKVRRGLGTDDETKADLLVAQLNELLSNETWWSGDRRGEAERLFEPVVVSGFFDGIGASELNPRLRRDAIIPMPSCEDGYSRILFLGTTGAGKTTLLRHLIGSDPVTDRFPSTSTAKTTTADIEIITAPGPFQAVVTFMPEHEVRAHIEECLEEACMEAVQGRSNAKIMGALLQHREQRFRLSYILGSWSDSTTADDDGDFDFDDEPESFESAIDDDETVSPEERAGYATHLQGVLRSVRTIAKEVETATAAALGSLATQKTSDDRAAWLELFGNDVYEHQSFSDLVLDLFDQIQTRFAAISDGKTVEGQSGWPAYWSSAEEDRSTFLRQIRWFSGNHHKQFGKLLTPLVEGIRVSGPLFSELGDPDKHSKFVLLDGQGLGHTPTSASSISTRITERFSEVDMILLVDNAQQPMQAAPLALLRTIGSSGYANKLSVAFTHFDQVRGANLATFDQKREHVAASVVNAVASLRDVVGAGVAGALDRQIDRRATFLGGLDRPTDRLPPGFRRELLNLLDLMARASEPDEPSEAVAIYEFNGLEIAMRDAIDGFREPWRARLGLSYHDGIAKEHWTRVKALTRRFANGWADEYDTLRPVSDLLSRLQEEASKWLERPVEWEGSSNDEQREVALDKIRQSVFSRLSQLTRRRLKDEPIAEWRTAFDFSGTGSGMRRSLVIDGINEGAAPHLSAAMRDDAREFLSKLYGLLQEAIEEAGGKYRVPSS